MLENPPPPGKRRGRPKKGDDGRSELISTRLKLAEAAAFFEIAEHEHKQPHTLLRLLVLRHIRGARRRRLAFR